MAKKAEDIQNKQKKENMLMGWSNGFK